MCDRVQSLPGRVLGCFGGVVRCDGSLLRELLVLVTVATPLEVVGVAS